MAQQPPVTTTSSAPATPQKSSGCFGRGCVTGCGGCLVVILLAGLLIAGSGYWFFVVQASAAVSAPATLIVYNQPVTVDNKTATAGEPLNAGNEVATKDKGHADIQFPDGSYLKLSPNTTVQITSIHLQKNGQLQS